MAVAPPAFPFYVGDFIVGTADYSTEQIGAYLLLLLFQWSNDGIPDDADERQIIMRLDPRKCVRHWRKIARKFRQGSDGRWRNERLEIERANQLQRRDIASRLGRAAAFKRWAGTHAVGNADGMPDPMPGAIRSDSLSSFSTYIGTTSTSDRTDPSVLGTSRDGKDTARRAEIPPDHNERNDHANEIDPPTGSDPAAPAIGDRVAGNRQRDDVRGLERPDHRPGDRGRIRVAPSAPVVPHDAPMRGDGDAPTGSAGVVVVATDDTATATNRDAAPRPDDPPAAATGRDRTVDAYRVGPSDADRDRVRMLKARIGDASDPVHPAGRPRGRSRPVRRS